SLAPSIAPSSDSSGPSGLPASSAASTSSAASPSSDSSASFAFSAPPAASTPPASSTPPYPLISSTSFAPPTFPASSDSPASCTSMASSTSIASSAPPASFASSASFVPYSASTQDQYQSIMSSLQNLVTQDQFQSLVSMIRRLEDTVMGLRNDVSRNSEWTERTIGIHERRQLRQASPYSSNTALTPSPQRRHHRLSGSTSPTASQHSIMSFNGVTTSTPREE
ncbi:hypothetical protein K457DRAFT_143243, partial [Linnemannia elongata AG-77]